MEEIGSANGPFGLEEVLYQSRSHPLQGVARDGETLATSVVFTGMGSSMYAAYPAQAYLNSLGIRALIWETGELVDHLEVPRCRHTARGCLTIR